MDSTNSCQFNRAGEPWTRREDEQLNNLYNVDMLDIMQISAIHNRAPGGIISRLKKHHYIEDNVSARGYEDYKNSDIYKQHVANKSVNKKTKVLRVKPDKPNNNLDHVMIRINEYVELKEHIAELKEDMTDVKRTLKDLMDMMQAVYKFEST